MSVEFSGNFSLVINPILYAFEGNLKKIPTYRQFCESFDEAVSELKHFFKNAKIIAYPEEKYYLAAYEILKEVTASYESEKNFLIKTAPLVTEIPSNKEIKNIQNLIDDIATQYNLLGNSLCYYLVLSCLYDNKNNSDVYHAARKVLKPKKIYSETRAYNAISDLNALILYLQLLSQPDNVFHVCTCDKPLAAFWAGLNPIERKSENQKITITFPIDEDLFPRLTKKQRQHLFNNIEKKKKRIKAINTKR